MSFTGDMVKFKNIARKNIQETKQAVAIELFSSIIKGTPVDEGTLVANWQASVGAPIRSTTDNTDKNKTATVNEASAVAAVVKLGETIYLTNNLPYAHRIEFEGWSRIQAPQGMVRINIQRVAKKIKSLIKR